MQRVKGLENEMANSKVYNVGTGVATDVVTVANTLKKYYNIEIPIEISGNYRLGDIRHNFADIDKIKSEFRIRASMEF